MKEYIVICVSEDGVSIRMLTKSELKKRVNSDFYGVPFCNESKIALNSLEPDLSCWKYGLHVIKGGFIDIESLNE